MAQDKISQEQLLEMFKSAVGERNYKKMEESYLLMTDNTALDAERYSWESEAMIKNRLKQLHETEVGKEIQKLEETRDWLWHAYAKIFDSELWYQRKK